MGNLSTDTINVLNNVGLANAEGIKPLTDLIGLIGDVGSVVGGINSIVQLVEEWQGTDQLTQINNSILQISNVIEDGFHQLGLDLGANQILIRNGQINEMISGPSSWYVLLKNAMGQQLSVLELNQYVEPCIQTLGQFDGTAQPDIVWFATFDWEVFWTDIGLNTNKCYNYPYIFSIDAGYGVKAPAELSDGDVFNYTFSMPVYLEAIWLFLAVAGALDPNFPQAYESTLKSVANNLSSMYLQILTNRRGLTTLSPPDWSAVGLILTPCPGASAKNVGIRLIYQQPVDPTKLNIEGALIEYGAVEKFSGASSVNDSYQINFYGLSDLFNPAMFNKLQLRVLKRTKDVYWNLGLANVWQVINSLKRLVGDPPLSPLSFLWNNGAQINLLDWSFRQIVGLAQLAAISNAYSLRSLAAFIIGTQPFDTPYSPGATSVSFRQLLTNFSD